MNNNPQTADAFSCNATGSDLAWLRSTRGIFVATALLFLLSWLIRPESLALGPLSGMIPFAAILAIIAIGQTLVIQQGGIDLSVPGVVSLSGVLISHMASNQGDGNLALALAVCLLMALTLGLLNGILVVCARVAPMVATLGTNALIYGVNMYYAGGTTLQVSRDFSALVNAKLFGISVLAYLAIFIVALVTFVIKKTVFGRRFEGVGSSACAARSMGVVANRYRIAAYTSASVLYAIGGVLLAGVMSMPSPFQGDNYLMPSIAATVLGGTSLYGGVGNLVATAIAAVFLVQLQQLVLSTGLSVGVQFLFHGAAILVGVAVYNINPRKLFRWLFRRGQADQWRHGPSRAATKR